MLLATFILMLLILSYLFLNMPNKKYLGVKNAFLVLLFTSSLVFAYEPGIRIAWDYRTGKVVNGGVYSRVKKMADGDLAFVYSEGPEVWIRKSNDQGKTWGNRVLVARQDGYNNTNAEMIQLQNGWLLYAWNGRPQKENSVPYIIKTKISKDLGATWQDEKLIYTADITFANGCWEPVMLQLPSGEIQLYFANENPYRNNHDQEITMVRSYNNGGSWTNPIATSYRAGGRDGMAVPVYLKNNKGIVYAIEDPGFNGNFKPVIISTSVQDNWTSGAVNGTSTKRWGALRNDYALAGNVYAGAPYLVQLPTGETVLCFQNALGRTNETPQMQVFIGDDQAKNFARPSTPLHLPAGGSGMWNALEVLDANTIMATSSVGGTTRDGLWIIQGKVIRPLSAYAGNITVDGISSNENEWKTNSSVFMGSYSNTNATVKTSYNADFFYLYFDVQDEKLNADSDLPWDDDGVEMYLDPKNKNCNGVCDGMYKFLFNIGNKTLHSKANTAGAWVDWSPAGVQYKIKLNGTVNNNADTDKGYSVEVAIPWNQLGGKPALDTGWGIHFKLHDDANGTAAEFHEDLSGNDPNKASTYLRIDLKEGANGQGLQGQYFKGKQFETPVLSRIDDEINFNWGDNSPDPVVPNDQFSVRWIGQIEPLYSELYTFHLKSDNGRRLWIDNKLVIDKWLNDWDIDYTGQIQLVAGKKYDIKIEYFEENGGANILFQWESARQVLQVVPKKQLFPGTGVVTNVEELELSDRNISLYPNPTKDNLTILSENVPSRIEIFNQLGQLQTMVLDVNTLDISQLSNGVYLAKIQIGERVNVVKVVKE